MTTVAYDGKTLATDSRATGAYVEDTCRKLFKIKGVFYGLAGTLTEVIAFVNWRKEGGDTPEIKELNAIEVSKEGVFYWEDNLVKIPCHTPCAIGTGAPFAMTAMKCGKTAIEAVEMAKALDAGTGGPVQSAKIRTDIIESHFA